MLSSEEEQVILAGHKRLPFPLDFCIPDNSHLLCHQYFSFPSWLCLFFSFTGRHSPSKALGISTPFITGE